MYLVKGLMAIGKKRKSTNYSWNSIMIGSRWWLSTKARKLPSHLTHLESFVLQLRGNHKSFLPLESTTHSDPHPTCKPWEEKRSTHNHMSLNSFLVTLPSSFTSNSPKGIVGSSEKIGQVNHNFCPSGENRMSIMSSPVVSL